MIIKGDRIAYAACIFPLTQRQDLNKSLGTRHRAAIGLSEETDAVIVVVSEETGMISYAYKGQLVRGVTLEELRAFLTSVILQTGRIKPGRCHRMAARTVPRTHGRRPGGRHQTRTAGWRQNRLANDLYGHAANGLLKDFWLESFFRCCWPLLIWLTVHNIRDEPDAPWHPRPSRTTFTNLPVLAVSADTSVRDPALRRIPFPSLSAARPTSSAILQANQIHAYGEPHAVLIPSYAFETACGRRRAAGRDRWLNVIPRQT